jgi:predicted ester cyclase
VELDDNKDLVCRFTEEVMNQGNLSALEDYLASDFVNHVTGDVGIPAYRSVVEWARQLQGDEGRNAIDDLIAEGDRVAAFITVSGRPAKELRLFGLTFPANGLAFSNKHVHVFRIRDGKLSEHWAIRDDLTMLSQLGATLTGPS